MVIHNFNCEGKLNAYRKIFIMYQYKIYKKDKRDFDVIKNVNVSKATFYRAIKVEFDGYEDLLVDVGKLYGLDTSIDQDVIDEINKLFSKYFNAIYFNERNIANEYYNLIQEKRDKYLNNILLITLYITELSYMLYEVNFTRTINRVRLKELYSDLSFFEGAMTEEQKFLFYTFSMILFMHTGEVDNANVYMKEALKYDNIFPEISAFLYYHISVFKRDQNENAYSLSYSKKAIEKFDEQLNYERSLMCRINLAVAYRRLGAYEDAEIAQNYCLMRVELGRDKYIEPVSKVTLGYIYINKAEYNKALDYLINVSDLYKQENINQLYIAYCYLKLNMKDEFNELYEELKEKDYQACYIPAMEFMQYAFNEEKNYNEICERFDKVIQSFNSYKFEYFIRELLYELVFDVLPIKEKKVVKYLEGYRNKLKLLP